MLPKIICHIMGSVDGRLLTDRWTLPFDGKDRTELLGVYAAVCRELGTDAWMFGKNTLCEGFFPERFHTTILTPSARPVTHIARRSSSRLFVVADLGADILFESSTVRGDNIVSILPETAPAAYLEYLRERNISYLFAGRNGSDLYLAMQILSEEFVLSRVLQIRYPDFTGIYRKIPCPNWIPEAVSRNCVPQFSA